jgi:hypothetical protein
MSKQGLYRWVSMVIAHCTQYRRYIHIVLEYRMIHTLHLVLLDHHHHLYSQRMSISLSSHYSVRPITCYLSTSDIISHTPPVISLGYLASDILRRTIGRPTGYYLSATVHSGPHIWPSVATWCYCLIAEGLITSQPGLSFECGLSHYSDHMVWLVSILKSF